MAKTRNIKLYNKNDLAILLYELQKDNDVNISIPESNSNINSEYTKEEILSLSKNSPFIGNSYYGFNKYTIKNGQLIYKF